MTVLINDQIRDANQNQDIRYVIKRSGKQVEYQSVLIRRAIEKANAEEKRA